MRMIVGEKPFSECKTEIRCTDRKSPSVPELDGMFTLVVNTGAASIQTYLTRADMISLSNGLMALVEMSEVTA